MANVFDSNPIVIDTVSSDVDVGSSAFGLSKAPFFIKKIVFSNPTAADVAVIKNYRGEVVAELQADSVAGNTEKVELDFDPCLHSQGLKILTADQTVTTGSILIYV